MKKQQPRTLALTKTTLRALDADQLAQPVGGGIPTTSLIRSVCKVCVTTTVSG